jgi:hypothetical protein
LLPLISGINRRLNLSLENNLSGTGTPSVYQRTNLTLPQRSIIFLYDRK